MKLLNFNLLTTTRLGILIINLLLFVVENQTQDIISLFNSLTPTTKAGT
jgi:hypothetical protein